MERRTFELPNSIRLYLPKDYASYCGGDPVRLLNETCEQSLTIRWDDTWIEFIAKNGGVAYRRSAVVRFRAHRKERMLNSVFCFLRVELGGGTSDAKDAGDSGVVLETANVNRAAFDAFLLKIASADTPLAIEDYD
jgi:hypothetical protein